MSTQRVQKTVRVVVLRDFWLTKSEIVQAGKLITVDGTTATRLIANRGARVATDADELKEEKPKASKKVVSEK